MLANAGVHALIEKPLIVGRDTAQELDRVCRNKSAAMRVAYHLRFHPALRCIRSLINEANSNIFSIRAIWGEYLPNWHPGEDYRQSYAARVDQSGGPLLTLSHVIDYIIEMAGPVADSSLFRSSHKVLGIDTEEVASLTLRHESGTLTSIQLDYLTQPTRHYIEISCSNGVISYDFQRDVLNHSDTNSEATATFHFGDPASLRERCFEDQIDDFLLRISSEMFGLDPHDQHVSSLLDYLSDN
jgi:predicted dehydrogenase